MRSHKDLVELLCEKGAPVDAANNVGFLISQFLNVYWAIPCNFCCCRYCLCSLLLVMLIRETGGRHSSPSCCKARLPSHHSSSVSIPAWVSPKPEEQCQLYERFHDTQFEITVLNMLYLSERWSPLWCCSQSWPSDSGWAAYLRRGICIKPSHSDDI